MYDASATALKKVSPSNLIKAGTASDFPITGNATIGGTLGVTGNTTIGGTLGVTGASTLTGNTAVGGTLAVTGAITASGGVSGNVTGNVSGSSGSCTGNSATTTSLATGRTIGMTGDVSYTSGSFNGSSNVTGLATLASSGVTSGSYGGAASIPSITVDAKGRVTAISTNSIDVALRSDLANTTSGYAGSRLSGFRQAGTGATARTVDDKLKDRVSVRDFGAVGDGVTDDTSAIQAAHAASFEVVYPNGIYYLANSITVAGSIRMLPNARFKVLATKTFTINAVVCANINQYIFEGNSIAFNGTFGNSDLYADWFGAVADSTLSASPAGTDSGIAINKAIVAANNGSTKFGTVILNSGIYLIKTPIISSTAGISIKGSGKYNTILTCNNSFSTNTVITMGGSGGPPSSLTGVGVVAPLGGVSTAYGIRVTGNGTFVSNVWINGFGVGVELNSTDVFLFDFASELCLYGVLITSSDVSVSNGTVYGNSAFGVLCQGISTNKESVIISNVRSTADAQIGFGITNSSNIIIKGCSAAHVNASKYANGGFVISGTSSNITIDSCKSFLGSQSVTASQIGFDITSSGGNILLCSCTSTNFNIGSYVNCSGNIIISNCIMENNTLYGIRAIYYNFLTITSCLCNYQGTGATSDSGIYITANAAYQKLIINSNNCSTSGGGTQDYGIRVTCTNSASSGIVSSNINAFNNVANLLIDGSNAVNITNINNIT
jgi:hypothetical protein